MHPSSTEPRLVVNFGFDPCVLDVSEDMKIRDRGEADAEFSRYTPVAGVGRTLVGVT